MTKKEKATREKEIYEQFWDIYNPDSHLIGKKFMSKIEDRHYGYVQMNKLVCALQWFEEKYGSENYRVRVTYTTSKYGGAGNRMHLEIYDKESGDLGFAYYEFCKGDEGYVAKTCEDDIKMYIKTLKEYGRYDPEKHYVV